MCWTVLITLRPPGSIVFTHAQTWQDKTDKHCCTEIISVMSVWAHMCHCPKNSQRATRRVNNVAQSVVLYALLACLLLLTLSYEWWSFNNDTKTIIITDESSSFSSSCMFSQDSPKPKTSISCRWEETTCLCVKWQLQATSGETGLDVSCVKISKVSARGVTIRSFCLWTEPD